MKISKYLLFICVLFSFTLIAQTSQEAIDKFQTKTQATITFKGQSGVPEFIKFPANQPLILKGGTLQEKVSSFLESNKELFNTELDVKEFAFESVKEDGYGLQSLTINQQHHGVPVFDGQLRFHFNKSKQLTAINGNYITNIKVNAAPTITAEAANEVALNRVNKQDINYSGKTIFAHKTSLFVFQKGLVENNLGSSFLVYEVEARNNTDVREYVYVNAHNGALVEQFTGMAHAMDRRVYEASYNDLVWSEGDGFPADLTIWQQNEVMASGHVYNFFNNAFGFVSYNNADSPMITINNDPNIDCPNANWNGYSANYCDGTATDDVIAHEWGHAYTEYTSGLIYAWQSGALNESFSDIWGETVDLINNYADEDDDVSLRTGCNSSDRWRIGEDATAFGGAIRDMWDPTCNYGPGKVSDIYYRCGDADYGGVHSNSGVPNHAYALLVDGGTYNGQTVNGIGLTKAAHIFWRTQSTYLTATSDFYTLADALEASCMDLLGFNLEGLSTEDAAAGPSNEILTIADYDELVKAILAVELRVDPVACGYQAILQETDDPCDAASDNPIFFEDWESGLGNWTLEQLPVNASSWESRDWEVTTNLPQGRLGHAAFATATNIGNCRSSMQNGIIRLESPEITIPVDYITGTFEMTFEHYIATEADYDGGNIKYRIDGNSAWQVLPQSAFIANPYNVNLASVADGNDNPMAEQAGFSGTDGGSNSGSWGRSTVDLSSIAGFGAGSTVQFRFEMGTDGCNGRVGWYVDDISIYNCSYALSTDNFTALKNTLKVYPNPSNDYFTLQNLNDLSLVKADIMDINGRLVKSVDLSQIQNTTTLDISSVASGIYFMKVYAQNANTVIKLIKE